MYINNSYNQIATIVISAYNYGYYILDALKSIALYIESDDYQVIIIDDCSTDNTEHIIKTNFTNGIEYYKNSQNSGKSICTKIGIQKATGKYFFVLDADDMFLPGKIEKSLNIFNKYSNVALVNHNYIEINIDGEELNEKSYRLSSGIHDGKTYITNFLSGNISLPIGFGSIFCTRTSILKELVNHIDKSFGQSIDSFLQVAAISSGNIYHIDEPLFKYRIHPKSLYKSKTPIERIKLLLKALQNISVLKKIQDNPGYFKVLNTRIKLLEHIIHSDKISAFLKTYFQFIVRTKSILIQPTIQFIYRKLGRI